MAKIKCSLAGKAAASGNCLVNDTVPFDPKPGKPVYCRNCIVRTSVEADFYGQVDGLADSFANQGRIHRTVMRYYDAARARYAPRPQSIADMEAERRYDNEHTRRAARGKMGGNPFGVFKPTRRRGPFPT